MTVLTYIPFLFPINFFMVYWYLLVIPLAFGISMIYKAIRMRNLSGYWRQVTMMTTQVVLAIIGLAIVLNVFVQFVIPRI